METFELPYYAIAVTLWTLSRFLFPCWLCCSAKFAVVQSGQCPIARIQLHSSKLSSLKNSFFLSLIFGIQMEFAIHFSRLAGEVQRSQFSELHFRFQKKKKIETAKGLSHLLRWLHASCLATANGQHWTQPKLLTQKAIIVRRGETWALHYRRYLEW